MTRGGGRLSVASHVLQGRRGSLRTSVSSNSTLNWSETNGVSTCHFHILDCPRRHRKSDHEMETYPAVDSRGLRALVIGGRQCNSGMQNNQSGFCVVVLLEMRLAINKPS